MAAITWRTLTGADTLGPAAVLNRAGDTLNQGFNIFDRVLQREQAANTSREDTANTAAKAGYLNLLQSVTNPQELEALRASGELQRMFSTLDPKIQDQVRAAEETRVASLRDQFLKGQQFNMDKAKWDALPTTDKIGVKVSQGEYGDATALLEQLPEGLRAQFAKMITDAKVASEDKAIQRDLQRSQIGQNNASAGLSTAQAAESGARAAGINIRTEGDKLDLEGKKVTAQEAQDIRNAINFASPHITTHLSLRAKGPEYTMTDTEVFRQIMADARAKGFSDNALLALENHLRTNLDSTRVTSNVGADAREVRGRRADTEKTYSDFMNQSAMGGEFISSFAGTKAVSQMIDDAAKNGRIPKEINDELRGVIQKYAKDGKIRIDGKEYPITVNAVAQALNAAGDDGVWFTTNKSDLFENNLVNIISSPQARKDWEKRTELEKEMRKYLVQDAVAGSPKK